MNKFPVNPDSCSLIAILGSEFRVRGSFLIPDYGMLKTNGSQITVFC